MLLGQDSPMPSHHQQQQRHLNTQILKSFYNKDASDSVTKSFLGLHTNVEFQLNETSSLSSLSSASISNKCAMYVFFCYY